MPDTPAAYPVIVRSTENADVPARGGTAPTYRAAGSTVPTTTGGSISTSAPELRVTVAPPHARASESDPELAWLGSPEAERYQGHWVALQAGTGIFLGLADSTEDLLRWRSQDASILFVVPGGEWIGG
jgi:hypothetical protein